jgi:hypothetical protein
MMVASTRPLVEIFSMQHDGLCEHKASSLFL